jgi:hypothetical protein
MSTFRFSESFIIEIFNWMSSHSNLIFMLIFAPKLVVTGLVLACKRARKSDATLTRVPPWMDRLKQRLAALVTARRTGVI